jgi:hypothetical protein
MSVVCAPTLVHQRSMYSTPSLHGKLCVQASLNTVARTALLASVPQDVAGHPSRLKTTPSSLGEVGVQVREWQAVQALAQLLAPLA